MNFALAPKSVPTKEIIASVEQGIKHLRNDEKNEVRERVCAVVKHAKCPQNKNLSRLEEKALKSLRGNKDILITKADKGNAVVVMNRADYQNQVNEMLEDKNIYTHITDKRRNPTSKTELELQDRLLRLKDTGHLTENQYKSLRPSDSYPAAFYGLPKIHKIPLIEKVDHFTVDTNVKIPMRPINSCIGSPNYQVSKHLASVLKHLYEGDHAVRNSKDFVDFVMTQTVEPDEQIVSFDVTSLFTSIPVDLALKIVKEELENTEIWKEHTKLTIEQIYSLLAFVLKNSFFVFNGKHYHQISGCAMGSPTHHHVIPDIQQFMERASEKVDLIQLYCDD
ncbi:Hypothetical predicted protein [Paramuricea clavata]|uniref:Uncharacterized protein n=1 Tax=Paramuricea clavata TaxID=317549 RepID=A0A6S7JA15_PARCT|nr:Hypothetical predicted protein [Paramuricea clavata]